MHDHTDAASTGRPGQAKRTLRGRRGRPGLRQLELWVTSPFSPTQHTSILHFCNDLAVSLKRARYLGKSGSAITDRACGLRDLVSIAASTARPYQPVACVLG